ncbi:MAG: phosphohistidine phosphatase SixA [Gammaproteobacteria bacterium]|nr:phosphohistidine phosphatase SixA [Gammaproteobacteria bacterium]
MKLYLLQHGKAHTAEEDASRSLSQKGVAEITRLAEFLKPKNIAIERILHSGKLRAQQTAEILNKGLVPTIEPEVSNMINPNDDPKAFAWQHESWDQNTLIVGHLPFLAKLVSMLVVNDENQPLLAFQPGTLVCLERSDNNNWQVCGMIRPEMLV